MTANAQMLVAFVALLCTAPVLKVAGLRAHRGEPLTPRERRLFFLSPFISVRTLRACPASAPRWLWAEARIAVLCVALLVVAYRWYWPLVSSLTSRPVILAYAGTPIFLVAAFGSAAAIEWIGAALGFPLAPVHRAPLLAASTREFWSRRWNRWVSDWLADVVRVRRLPLRLVAVFGLSGLLHELLLTVPLVLITGTNLVGTMMLFFGLHGLFTFVDVRFVRGRARRRAFFWLAMLATLPLFVNEALLRVLLLWPE